MPSRTLQDIKRLALHHGWKRGEESILDFIETMLFNNHAWNTLFCSRHDGR